MINAYLVYVLESAGTVVLAISQMVGLELIPDERPACLESSSLKKSRHTPRGLQRMSDDGRVEIALGHVDNLEKGANMLLRNCDCRFSPLYDMT